MGNLAGIFYTYIHKNILFVRIPRIFNFCPGLFNKNFCCYFFFPFSRELLETRLIAHDAEIQMDIYIYISTYFLLITWIFATDITGNSFRFNDSNDEKKKKKIYLTGSFSLLWLNFFAEIIIASSRLPRRRLCKKVGHSWRAWRNRKSFQNYWTVRGEFLFYEGIFFHQPPRYIY